MNKPEAHENLIPIRDFAAQYYSRRGYPVTVQYIYNLIKKHKETGKEISFQFVEKGKSIWIKK